ncbi:MAG: hypothetical protein M5U12_16165 [Verrucomicrobia bacterium]|nr:hypothetical protein [Verrucomicrobiota bacterium]
MSENVESLPVTMARWAGEAHPLTRQLARPADGVPGGDRGWVVPPAVRDLPTLRGFLAWYRTEVLAPTELPAIGQAFAHAGGYEVRELLALDRTLADEARLRPFAEASQAVGRAQLWRLLPLRDQRLIRRYWRALEAGGAHGWHVLVYGVVLSVFSLPLRSGLMHYGQQTLAGFVDSAGRRLGLREDDCTQLLVEEWATLPAVTDRALGPGKVLPRLCV